MPIEADLNTKLKAAMRARDKDTLGLVRMLKSKMTERTTSAGFSGDVDDALWLEVIEAYAKSQQKALEQFKELGEAGAEHVAALEWELTAMEEFLPKKADEATTRAWAQAAIDGMGGPENAKLGQVMGAVMKAHKADVDASLVRQIVAELLG